MVDHHVDLRFQQRRQQRGQAVRLRVEFDVPAERVQAMQRRLPRRGAQLRIGRADQIQPDADDALGVQLRQEGLGRGGVDHGHAAQALRGLPERGQQVAVVDTQEARLDQHAMRQAVRVQLREIGGQRGIVRRRVAARAGQRQAALEHMRVRVDAGDAGGRGRHAAGGAAGEGGGA